MKAGGIRLRVPLIKDKTLVAIPADASSSSIAV